MIVETGIGKLEEPIQTDLVEKEKEIETLKTLILKLRPNHLFTNPSKRVILSTEIERFDEAFCFTFKDIETEEIDFLSAKKVLQELFTFLDVEGMADEEVRRVFYEKVWLENKLDRIENIKISRKVLDFSCNINVKRGAILLERSLNSGWGKRIKVDGSIEEKEIRLINEIDEQGQSDILEKLICHYAANFYETFGKKKHIKHTLQWIFR